MKFFKGLLNALIFMACILATMLVIPECRAGDYVPVSTAWSADKVGLLPGDELGDFVECAVVDDDRKIISKKTVHLNWGRTVMFTDPESVEFGALGYCRSAEK